MAMTPHEHVATEKANGAEWEKADILKEQREALRIESAGTLETFQVLVPIPHHA